MGVPMPTVILQQGPMPGPLPQVQRTQPVMYAQQPVVMAHQQQQQQPPQGGPGRPQQIVLVPQAAAARGQQQGYAVGPLQPQYQIGPAGHAAHQQPNHGQQQATAAAAQAQAQQAAMLAQQRSQQVMQQQQAAQQQQRQAGPQSGGPQPRRQGQPHPGAGGHRKNGSSTSTPATSNQSTPAQTPDAPLSRSSSQQAQQPGGHVVTPVYERLVSEEVKEIKEYVRLIEHQSRRLAELERVHDDLELRLEREHAARVRVERSYGRSEQRWKARCARLESERAEGNARLAEERSKVERLMEVVNGYKREIHALITTKFHGNGERGGPFGEGGGRYVDGRGAQHQFIPPRDGSGGSPGSSVDNRAARMKRAASAQAGGSRSPGHAGGGGSVDSSDERTGGGGGHGRDERQQQAGGGRKEERRHIGPHEILAHNGSAAAVRERNAYESLLDFFGM